MYMYIKTTKSLTHVVYYFAIHCIICISHNDNKNYCNQQCDFYYHYDTIYTMISKIMEKSAATPEMKVNHS